MQVLTVFEVPTRREVTVAAPPLPLLYGGGGVPGTPIWNSDSRCFRIRRVERGYTAEVPANQYFFLYCGECGREQRQRTGIGHTMLNVWRLAD